MNSNLRNLRGYFVLPELEQRGQVRRIGRGVIHQIYHLGGTLVLVIAGGGAGLFDLDKGMALWEIDCPAHSGVLSPDERLLALGSKAAIHIWDPTSGRLLHTLPGHEKWVGDVTFSPDGQILASSGGDGTVRLTQVGDWTQLRVIRHLQTPIGRLAFAPDGQTLAGAADRWVRLWRVDDGALQHTLIGMTDEVVDLAFAPNGGTLIAGSGSDDTTVRLWRVNDGTLLSLFGHTAGVTCVAFAPDGQFLAAGAWDNSVRIWRISDGIPPGMINSDNEIDATEGQFLVYNPHGDETWHVDKDTSLHTLFAHVEEGARRASAFKPVLSVAFGKDADILVSGSDDGIIYLWRVADGALLDTFAGFQWQIRNVAFASDGQSIAAWEYGDGAQIWRIQDGKLLNTLNTGRVQNPTPDARPLAETYRYGTITPSPPYKWPPHHSRLLRKYGLDPFDVRSIAVSPDRTLLATPSHDGTIRLWRLDNNDILGDN